MQLILKLDGTVTTTPITSLGDFKEKSFYTITGHCKHARFEGTEVFTYVFRKQDGSLELIVCDKLSKLISDGNVIAH